jgi:hypothetical protein
LQHVLVPVGEGVAFGGEVVNEEGEAEEDVTEKEEDAEFGEVVWVGWGVLLYLKVWEYWRSW